MKAILRGGPHDGEWIEFNDADDPHYSLSFVAPQEDPPYILKSSQYFLTGTVELTPAIAEHLSAPASFLTYDYIGAVDRLDDS